MIRRLLGRDRLERTEQTARQADSMVAAMQERFDHCEFELRRLRDELDDVVASLGRLDAMVREADPVQARQVLDAARSDVSRLIVEVSELVAARATQPDSCPDQG